MASNLTICRGFLLLYKFSPGFLYFAFLKSIVDVASLISSFMVLMIVQ